jgi:hypothetical protein
MGASAANSACTISDGPAFTIQIATRSESDTATTVQGSPSFQRALRFIRDIHSSNQTNSFQKNLVKNACEKFHDEATSPPLSIKLSFCSGDRCPQKAVFTLDSMRSLRTTLALPRLVGAAVLFGGFVSLERGFIVL